MEEEWNVILYNYEKKITLSTIRDNIMMTELLCSRLLKLHFHHKIHIMAPYVAYENLDWLMLSISISSQIREVKRIEKVHFLNYTVSHIYTHRTYFAGHRRNHISWVHFLIFFQAAFSFKPDFYVDEINVNLWIVNLWIAIWWICE